MSRGKVYSPFKWVADISRVVHHLPATPFWEEGFPFRLLTSWGSFSGPRVGCFVAKAVLADVVEWSDSTPGKISIIHNE